MQNIKLSPFKRFLLIGLCFMTNIFMNTRFSCALVWHTTANTQNLADAGCASQCILLNNSYVSGKWGNNLLLYLAGNSGCIISDRCYCMNETEVAMFNSLDRMTCGSFSGFADYPAIAPAYLAIGSCMGTVALPAGIVASTNCNCVDLNYIKKLVSTTVNNLSYFIQICSECSTGQIASNNQCVPCPAGTYKALGNTCTPCSIGYYNSLTGQTTCSSCPYGTIANTSFVFVQYGNTHYGTAAGVYTSSTGASAITECYVGNSYCSTNCTSTHYLAGNIDKTGFYYPTKNCYYSY